MSIIGFLGTSRKNGNTAILANALFRRLDDAELFDLSDYSIAPYAYDFRHEGDDFLYLARKMAAADAVVFASPVYWYTMSAQMKLFFDRITDLTKRHKDLGRALKGKPLFAVGTGSEAPPTPSFEPPFRETALYLDMRWGGLLYAAFDEDLRLPRQADKDIENFAQIILNSANALAK